MLIAECCSNWIDLDMARQMIFSAKENGADLVKFQLFDAEDDKGKPWYEWVKLHELTFDQAKMLFDFGRRLGIEIFFSVFGVKFVGWCENIGFKRYKVACNFRDNLTLGAIKSTGKQVIISMESLDSIDFRDFCHIKRLYCVPKYPVKPVDINLRFIDDFEGFSDHTIGMDIAKIALGRGSQIIEKHFCLDRNSQAPDIAWSMIPEELRELKRWETLCNQVF